MNDKSLNDEKTVYFMRHGHSCANIYLLRGVKRIIKNDIKKRVSGSFSKRNSTPPKIGGNNSQKQEPQQVINNSQQQKLAQGNKSQQQESPVYTRNKHQLKKDSRDWFDGEDNVDSYLNELGVLQAIFAGYKTDFGNKPPEVYYSSAMVRAIETCFFFLLGRYIKQNPDNNNKTQQNTQKGSNKKFCINITPYVKEDGSRTSDKLKSKTEIKNFLANLKKPEFLEQFIFNKNYAVFVNNFMFNKIGNEEDTDKKTVLDWITNNKQFFKNNLRNAGKTINNEDYKKYKNKTIEEILGIKINNTNSKTVAEEKEKLQKKLDENKLKKFCDSIQFKFIDNSNSNSNSNYSKQTEFSNAKINFQKFKEILKKERHNNIFVVSHSHTIKQTYCGVSKYKFLKKIQNTSIVSLKFTNNEYKKNNIQNKKEFGKCKIIYSPDKNLQAGTIFKDLFKDITKGNGIKKDYKQMFLKNTLCQKQDEFTKEMTYKIEEENLECNKSENLTSHQQPSQQTSIKPQNQSQQPLQQPSQQPSQQPLQQPSIKPQNQSQQKSIPIIKRILQVLLFPFYFAYRFGKKKISGIKSYSINPRNSEIAPHTRKSNFMLSTNSWKNKNKKRK